VNRAFVCLIYLSCVIAAAGCSRSRQTTAQTIASPQAQLDVSIQRGGTIFSANCAACHGATGREGGVGPALTGERRKMNLDATIAWIENPNPPMPKLFPTPLNERDVADVAAYVESL